MRAAVLLCLLEDALIRANMYAWRGQVVDSKTENGVVWLLSDAAADTKDEDVTELEQELTKTKNILNNIRASRSAFSVSLINENNFNCSGPFPDDKLIPYKHVSINLGDSYSTDTGIFTVPRSGVYSLALTIYSDAGAPGNTLAACASLQVNGLVVAGSKDRNMQDQEDSATIVVALHLNAGDEVAVNLPIGSFLCDDNSHYSLAVCY
ncbi:complement C1q-like protein 4 [Notothenia coriiceps]|uniref:Complement C1q-like protein 4 n=1 Tax=Notothenia coriiceps TaxID=8208 RepID=A0A6I9PWW7_9TELE|nr:PREDICTED: complement C1q-like protein 4 [Notothenia coriiceps]